MNTIKITCDGCSKVHTVKRTSEIPSNVISIGCNWCPDCEDTAQDYYKEWYNYNNGGDNDGNEPSNDPNQLVMPFSVNDILKDHKIKEKA